MSLVRCQISVSLDGYVAGPNQRPDEPLGDGGELLHDWAFATEISPRDREIREEVRGGIGAYIMGRGMFDGAYGPPDPSWRGWWGDEPPYHVPVFVLTSHPREALEMQGGTTFNFVTDGIESALRQARDAAGDRDVMVAGGAACVNQYLAAGAIDELYLHVAPRILGGGSRLFEDVGDLQLEPVEVVASPHATHVKYRIHRKEQ